MSWQHGFGKAQHANNFWWEGATVESLVWCHVTSRWHGVKVSPASAAALPVSRHQDNVGGNRGKKDAYNESFFCSHRETSNQDLGKVWKSALIDRSSIQLRTVEASLLV